MSKEVAAGLPELKTLTTFAIVDDHLAVTLIRRLHDWLPSLTDLTIYDAALLTRADLDALLQLDGIERVEVHNLSRENVSMGSTAEFGT